MSQISWGDPGTWEQIPNNIGLCIFTASLTKYKIKWTINIRVAMNLSRALDPHKVDTGAAPVQFTCQGLQMVQGVPVYRQGGWKTIID